MPDFHEPIEPDEAAALRRELAAVPDDVPLSQPEMSRDAALLRLGDELPAGAFATVIVTEVALANPDVAADLRAGQAARFSREWSVLITAPGYSHTHAGDQLGPVVEQALADYLAWRGARDAEEWARTAIPDKPPKLLAPGTADERRDAGRRSKDAG